MISWLIGIVGMFLLIVSIIDIKTRSIPSILLTGMLFVVAFLTPTHLWFGIIGFIIAYLMFEADFFSGIADIKVMTMLSFMIGTINWMFALIILTLLFGFVWKVLIKWRFKKMKDYAFLPVFFFIYLALTILGGIR